MHDQNGNTIQLNDRVIVKYAGKIVEGRVVTIDERQPCVKVKVGQRFHKMLRPFEVQVFAHWS